MEIEIICKKCERVMVSESISDGIESLNRIDHESLCRRCSDGLTLEEITERFLREHRAQSYLTDAALRRFRASRIEMLRRVAHNAVHAVREWLGYRHCPICFGLAINRLEPQPIDHVRPMSHFRSST